MKCPIELTLAEADEAIIQDRGLQTLGEVKDAVNKIIAAKFQAWVEGLTRLYSFKGVRETIWHPHHVGGDTHVTRILPPEEIGK